MVKKEKEESTIKRLAGAMMVKNQTFTPSVTEEQIKARNMFWCCRNTERIHTEVCIHRQEDEKEGCIRCRQGKFVKKFTIEKLQALRPKRHRTI